MASFAEELRKDVFEHNFVDVDNLFKREINNNVRIFTEGIKKICIRVAKNGESSISGYLTIYDENIVYNCTELDIGYSVAIEKK